MCPHAFLRCNYDRQPTCSHNFLEDQVLFVRARARDAEKTQSCVHHRNLSDYCASAMKRIFSP